MFRHLIMSPDCPVSLMKLKQLLFCFVLEVGEKNEPNISSGSEDHFSFFPSQSYNEDIDKGFYEKDDFDPSFFDSKTSDKGSKSIEELVS